jgi:hypothetical protein
MRWYDLAISPVPAPWIQGLAALHSGRCHGRRSGELMLRNRPVVTLNKLLTVQENTFLENQKTQSSIARSLNERGCWQPVEGGDALVQLAEKPINHQSH